MALADDLCVSNVTIVNNGRLLVEGINHCFKAGTVTLILGHSGSGKTMLLEALSGLRTIEPGGNISIGSMELWSGTHAKRKLQRQALLRIGTSFQHSEQQLFALTVEAEFSYNLRPYQLKAGIKQQRIKQASSLISEDTAGVLKKNPFKLSGGQKRRLTLALVEATEPDWLLLDEPTSGVDASGVKQLEQYLKRRKALGQGTIVVTHELEGLIDTADQLLIIKSGHLVWSGSPENLLQQPSILESAGLSLPASLETQRMLQQVGFIVPVTWPSVASTTEMILHQLKTVQANNNQSTEITLPVAEEHFTAIVNTEKHNIPMKRFDPRTLWLIYIFISSGILMQSTWLGWVVSAAVALTVIMLSRVPFRRWSRPAWGLLIFMGIAGLLGGISLGGAGEELQETWHIADNIHFAYGIAGATLYHFSRLMMIMLIGFVLLSNMKHLQLKRALEQGLHGLRRLRLPIEQFALTAGLMVRFLPLLMQEWEKFARIAAARGKYAASPGRIPIRGMRITVIPFLMSLIRLGDLLSLILIMRGIGVSGRVETRAYRLRFNKPDYLLVLGAIGILIGLIMIARVD